MKTRTFVVLIMVLGLLVPSDKLATVAAFAGPCLPGAVYDPACDVDHDGDVDIFDVQLTASRWNRTGTWVSDNGHDHLGQTWTGHNNPLTIQGSFLGSAPLRLSNSAGAGLNVIGGLYVESVTQGLYVNNAGANGVEVASAGGHGMRIDSAAIDGIWVLTSGDDGFFVGTAGGDGFYVQSAFYSGLVVNDAGNDGVLVREATNWAGRFIGNISVSGSCTGCLQASFAVNAGDRALQPGDVAADHRHRRTGAAVTQIEPQRTPRDEV